MRDVRIHEGEPAFPAFGARARVWGRFERDPRAWLATPEGRFAAWRASVAIPRLRSAGPVGLGDGAAGSGGPAVPRPR